MSWSIEYRGAEGAAASEACRTAAQYQAAVAQLLRQHVARGHVLEDEHGQLLPFTRYVIRTSDGAEHEGRSDHRGQTCLVFTDAEDDLEVEILPDDCTDYEEPEG